MKVNINILDSRSERMAWCDSPTSIGLNVYEVRRVYQVQVSSHGIYYAMTREPNEMQAGVAG